MAARSHIFALCVLGLFNVAISQVFPTMEEIEKAGYLTEVSVVDAKREATAFAKEYYDGISANGKVEISVAGEQEQYYWNSGANDVVTTNATYCTVEQADTSDFYFYGAFYGWHNKNPLVLGPSAPLFYAQTRRSDIEYNGTESVRGIPCDKYILTINEKGQNVLLEYYFEANEWTTAYQDPSFRVPIRIHAIGTSSSETQDDVDIYTDFAYYMPYVEYSEIHPPPGLGCMGRALSNSFPEIPKKYQYTAEVVDLLYQEESDDVDVRLERVWYDGEQEVARLDIYKKTTSSSSFQDYNTGVMFEFTKERQCAMRPIRNAFFQKYEVDEIGEMKNEYEVLNLDGDFYNMGRKWIRGIICDGYESVERNLTYSDGQVLDRLVVTAYFSEGTMKAGVNGEEVSRVPILIIVTGWKNTTHQAFRRQYNIALFEDWLYKEMFADFGLEECYPKAERKAYFSMLIEAPPNMAAKMESQNDLIVQEVRAVVSNHSHTLGWRMPYLKIDYKEIGVYATGMMVESPPQLQQFYKFSEGNKKVWKKEFGVAAYFNLEDCSRACIENDDPPCKGFYFCNDVCFLKFTAPSNREHDPNDVLETLENCQEYLRAVQLSSNYHNPSLKTALKSLVKAVEDENINVVFEIPGGLGYAKIAEIVVSPDADVDDENGAYKMESQFRKIDSKSMTSKVQEAVETLNDCYLKCKDAGSECSSFSFCGRSAGRYKECITSSELIVRGKSNDRDLVPTAECDIYDLNFLAFFTKYPEHVSLVNGYQVNSNVESVKDCAKQCRLEEQGKCRGFEYCSSSKTCSLHTQHVLDLAAGEKGKNLCVHYAARFIADFEDLGTTLLDDSSNIRYDITLEECARVCSEELSDGCKSFNYCPTSRGSCALSGSKLADKGKSTTEQTGCKHFEKRAGVKDWSNTKAKEFPKSGYTKKGFTGLVIGMLALGLIIGALGFVGYSYVRSRRNGGEGLTVKFMKQET